MIHSKHAVNDRQSTGSTATFAAEQQLTYRHQELMPEVSNVEDPRELGLDNTLEQTFPCSDPLSSIPNPHLRCK